MERMAMSRMGDRTRVKASKREGASGPQRGRIRVTHSALGRNPPHPKCHLGLLRRLGSIPMPELPWTLIDILLAVVPLLPEDTLGKREIRHWSPLQRC